MVSYGPDIQSLNYTHMYSFVDYRGCRCEPQITKGSIYDYVNSQPDMKLFKKVIDNSLLTGQLNDKEANFTIFIPTDDYLKKYYHPNYFDNLDGNEAKSLMDSCILNRRISSDIIKSSPVAYYSTRNLAMRMFVTNISGETILNNCAKVVKFDINLNNGVIHIIDNLLRQTDDTFMN